MIHFAGTAALRDLLCDTAIGGLMVAWDDPLHQGPAPGGLPLREYSAIRSAHLARIGAGVPDTLKRDMIRRDSVFLGSRQASEIVLWFGPGLPGQAQLMQVLFEAGRLGFAAPISMVESNEDLSAAAVETLETAFAQRRRCETAHFETAAQWWAAFTSGDRRKLAEIPAAGLAAFPFLAAATAERSKR